EQALGQAGGVYLFGVYGGAGALSGTPIDVPTCKAFMADFVRRAGAPDDPIERLLVEQLALGHHALGTRLFRAGCPEGADETGAYQGAGARLMAECRRSALALRALREGTVRKQARRSVGAGGTARARKGRATCEAASHARTEQGSNGHNRMTEYLHEPEL